MATKQTNPSSGKPDKKLSSVATSYLVVYNVAQTIGWSGLLFSLVKHYVDRGDHRGSYKATETLLQVFQTAAVLEIVHCAIGIVKSSVVLTTFQVFSRVFLTWGIAHSVTEVQNNVGVPVFLLAWSITEVIRYSLYSLNLINQVPYFLQWCRYTFFIVLYPIGVTGELLCIYAALPYVKRTGLYSVSLPNRLNISFSYYYYLLFVMVSYLPVFPQLYFHMFRQRRKIIGGETKKTQ